jgi:sugar lactone lactonase YvrE
MWAGMKRGRHSGRNAFLAAWCVLWLGSHAGYGSGASIFPVRLEDPEAIYLTPDQFPVTGDGIADDSDALQQAIDRVAARNQSGVLFVPQGIYRLSRTVYVWPGVRLIGFGKLRPVFVLGENTPGFQEGDGKYMLFFSGGRGRGESAAPRDGNPGTFYSALSNINLEIREGNPAAVGIRFHVAQHCFLAHMELRLGSARAGLEDIGNEVEDLHFQGGQYGIVTGRSAPGWPILVIDCAFERQAVAAISSKEAGLTVVRPRFKKLPTAISTSPGHPDQLWVSDAALEDITGAAFVISRENNARTQINLENVACTAVPTLVRFRESGELVQRGEPAYVVDRFSRGLQLGAGGATREIKTTLAIRPSVAPPAAVRRDIPELPPGEPWANVRTLGVRGDGATDDTGALREAIAKHRALYLPLGVYRVSDTLKLRPDTVLVGLHPSATVIHLPNDTPAFQDAASARAVVEAPPGGSNVLSGIGIYASPLNPGAVAVKWMAGQFSLMNDVRLHGGHGTRLPGGIGDSRGRDHRDRWGTQHPSLWVTEGGGGVFKDIWTPSPYARAGMLVSKTSTPGRVYAMSAEHHVSNEVIIRDAANWRFHALQFEEEREESARALPLRIENCRHLLFANTFFYRVVSSFVPQPYAIRVSGSSDVRLRNIHVYSNSKVSFDNSVFDAGTGLEVRDSEFAVFDVGDQAVAVSKEPGHCVVAPGAKVQKLAGGFFNISGAAVDGGGNVYFADPRELQIYRWSAARRRLEPVCKVPERPEQLGFDRAGNLLIVAYEGNGTVLSWNPQASERGLERLRPQPARVRPGKVPVLPVNRWMGSNHFMADSTMRKPYHYVSPDGTTFIPAGADFTTGSVTWGVKLADLLRAFSLAPAGAESRFYVSNEAELRTWSFRVAADGTLTDPEVFVEEGGEAVAVDHQGQVYIAAGQVRVFSPTGEPIDVIEIPERPTCLVFGGPDRKTLFVTARSSLYSISVR